MTDIKGLRKRVDKGLRRTLHYISPAAKVVKEITGALAVAARPTPIAVVNAVTSGLNTIHELVEVDDDAPGWGYPTFIERGTMLDALRRAGFREEHGKIDKGMVPEFWVGATRMRVDPAGVLRFWEDPRPQALELVRKALDAVLPPVLFLTPPERDSDRAVVVPHTLVDLVPHETERIADRTLKLLGDRRAIMLEGRPGVGKTTMAQAIAAKVKLGRILILNNYYMAHVNLLSEMFAQLSIGVLIVDDIDKIRVSLSNFERLRNNARLTIVTANNGTYDTVIDAALARPARIDEVFTITASAPYQAPPFDKLDAATWAVVSQWPQAYLNELALRLTHTPDDIRSEDLVRRMGLRTRSVDGLEGNSDPPHSGGSRADMPFEIRMASINAKHGLVDTPDDFDE